MTPLFIITVEVVIPVGIILALWLWVCWDGYIRRCKLERQMVEWAS